MPVETKHFYEFKNFRLDLAERVLLRDGRPLALTPKAFHLLKILVENHGHIVDKDKLITEIWADSFVEDGNLAVSATMLRKVLADDANAPTFIETVPRRGYRFIADVSENFENVGPATELNGKNGTEPPHQISNRSHLSLGAASMLVIGLAGIGVWYATFLFSNTEPSAPVLSTPFRATKFSTSGTVANAIISPNGKYAAFTDKSGGKESIWLRQLDSGENIQIVPPSDDLYFGLEFSNDGNAIYFVRRPSRRVGHGVASLYRVMTFGGIPVKILDNARDWISLSPDDKQIAFVRCNYRPDNFCSLLIADADGKNERTLLTRPQPIVIENLQFSPDGRSIAFTSGQNMPLGDPDTSLFLIYTETGKETQVLSRKFFDIKSARWMPSGDGLLFTVRDYTDGQIAIWTVSLASGNAQPLTKDAVSYEQISLDKKGERMIATQLGSDFQIYVSSENDVKTLASASDMTVAPDGKIVYSTFDGDIWSINRDGGDQRQLTTGPSGDSSPLASNDNRYIFFTSNQSGSNHVWRMNSDGTDPMQITRERGGRPCAVSPDGKWLYYRSVDERPRKVPGDGGEEIQISDKKTLRAVCSPDGNFIAYFFLDKVFKIGIMNTVDQSVVKVLDYGDGKSFAQKLAWSPDGRTIYFLTDSDGKKTLWQQSLNEDKPHFVADLGNEEIRDLAMMPDGNSYAFIRGKWINDAVLIEGLK